MKVIWAGFPWMLSLLFSLVSLAPGRALAVSEVPVPPEALPAEPQSTSPNELEPSSKSAVLTVLHTSARIVVEVGAMSATSFVMGIPGVFVAGLIDQDAQGGTTGIGFDLDVPIAGFFAGAAVGAPIGIMWGGRLLDGKGTWGGTLLGSGIGAGTGAVTALVLVKKGDWALIPVAAFAGSILGSFVGYEVSHATSSTSPAPSEVHVQPLVSVTQGGMMMGLGGRF